MTRLIDEALASDPQVQRDTERREKRLRAEVQSWKRKWESAELEIEEWKSRFEVVDILGDAKPRPVKAPKSGKKSHGTAALLILSDWHVEEDVDPATCNGLNRFDLKVAEKRVHAAFRRGVELIEAWRKSWPIDEVYCCVLGDLITGYIHEELEESNHLSPTEAIMFAEQLLVDGLAYLSGELKCPVVVPTCYGNHGRTTTRKRIKTGYANSYEWLLYSFLARHASAGVEWRVEKGYHNWQSVKGHAVRLHHGDHIKYQGGVGGISIPVNKAVAAWNKSRVAGYDYFGHWHQFIDQWNWTSAGCLIGYNDFSVAIKADYQPPTQTLSLISRSHGKVATMPVFLED